MVGGVVMLMLPIVHQQLEVLQMVPVWGILWTWDAIRRLCRNPTMWRGLETGAAFGMTFMISVHHGLFMALLLPACGVLALRRFRDRVFWRSTAGAAALGLVLVASLAWPIHKIADRHQFEREPNAVKQLSMKPSDYATVAPHAFIDPDIVTGRRGWEYCPGWIKVLLAAMGLAFAFPRRRHRDWRIFLATTALLAALLSLGPNLHIGSWQPWLTLATWIPGVQQVRNVFRFAYFVQMSIALLAVAGLQDLVSVLKARAQRRWRRTAAILATLTCGSLSVLEIPPAPYLLAGVPNLAAHEGWTTFVRDHTPPNKAIACIPFAGGRGVADFDISTRWMLLGTKHSVPLVNGYSGFFPESYFAIRDAVQGEFPSASALETLAAANVEFLVVYRSHTNHQQVMSVESSMINPEYVYEDPVGIDVYRLSHRQKRQSE